MQFEFSTSPVYVTLGLFTFYFKILISSKSLATEQPSKIKGPNNHQIDRFRQSNQSPLKHLLSKRLQRTCAETTGAKRSALKTGIETAGAKTTKFKIIRTETTGVKATDEIRFAVKITSVKMNSIKRIALEGLAQK